MKNENKLIPKIGLEIHCQLNTKSKLFCSCSTDFRNDNPNTHVCPTCLGLPGSLPVLNKKSIEYGIKICLSLNCSISNVGIFCRKNYFYPDLTKAFQITMGEKPLGFDGYLTINEDDNKLKKINISRIHLEEDPGRLVHINNHENSYTLVDYNRSGIPLVEIVTSPDIQSPKEARLFLNKLRTTLEYLDVFDSDNEGSLRVDANISLNGNNRVEIKNISSYRGVEKALTYEINRQTELINSNKFIEMETRHYHEDTGITTSGRNKEKSVDYRYFPEPDLPVIMVSEWVKDINLPELPDIKSKRFINEYLISPHYAYVLTSDINLANFYEMVCNVNPILSSAWIVDILLGELNYRDMKINEIITHKEYIVELIEILNNHLITDKSGVIVIRLILDQIKLGKNVEKPYDIIKRMNLNKESVDSFVDKIKMIVRNNKKAIDDHLSGKKGALNYIVGQVMKETKGKADPAEVHDIIEKLISKKTE